MDEFKCNDLETMEAKTSELGRAIEEAANGIAKFSNDVTALAESGGTVNIGEQIAAILGDMQEQFKRMESDFADMNKVYTTYVVGMQQAANMNVGGELNI